MRADYCPMANEPCQCMCDQPCSAHRLKPADDSDMAVYKAIAENYTAPKAQQPALSKDQIREVFMAHGFTIKDGQTDLKQYVYDAAYALLGQQPAPVQENSYEWQCGYLQGVHDGVTKTRPAQQPRKAVKLSDSEIEKLQYEHVGVTKWFPNLARAIEQAVWEKLGVTE